MFDILRLHNWTHYKKFTGKKTFELTQSFTWFTINWKLKKFKICFENILKIVKMMFWENALAVTMFKISLSTALKSCIFISHEIYKKNLFHFKKIAQRFPFDNLFIFYMSDRILLLYSVLVFSVHTFMLMHFMMYIRTKANFLINKLFLLYIMDLELHEFSFFFSSYKVLLLDFWQNFTVISNSSNIPLHC